MGTARETATAKHTLHVWAHSCCRLHVIRVPGASKDAYSVMLFMPMRVGFLDQHDFNKMLRCHWRLPTAPFEIGSVSLSMTKPRFGVICQYLLGFRLTDSLTTIRHRSSKVRALSHLAWGTLDRITRSLSFSAADPTPPL